MKNLRRPSARRLLITVVSLAVVFAAGLLAASTVAGAGPLAALTGTTTTDTTTTDMSSTDTSSTSTDTGTTDTSSTSTTTTDTTPTDTSSSSTTTTTTAAPPPSISSDQVDYPPGATVTLTGTGWAPAEAVHIFVNDNVGNTWSYSIDVTASLDGAFTIQFTLPDWFVASYSVTATGATSGTATTSFTDALAVNINNKNVQPWFPTASPTVAISGTYSCQGGGCTSVSKVRLEIYPSNGVSGSVGGSLVASFDISVSATGNNNPWSHTFSLSGQSEGLYDVKAILTYNTSSTTTDISDDHFGVDTTKPTSAISTVTAGTLPSATGTANDPGTVGPPRTYSGFDNSDSTKPMHVEIHTDPADVLVGGSAQDLTLTGLGSAKQTGTWSYTYGGSALAPGGYCIVSRATDHGGNAQGPVTKSCFTVAAPDSTAPTIGYSQSPNGSNGWFKTAPAKVTVTATDGDDGGVASISCTLDGSPVTLTNTGSTATTRFGDISTSNEGDHTVSCTATDPTGNTTSPAVTTHLKLDKTAPTFTCASSPPAGWSNSEFSTSCTSSDTGGSDNVSPASFTLSTSVDAGNVDSNASTNLQVISDDAGNQTAAQFTGIKIDRSSPSITKSIHAGPHYNNGSDDFVTSTTTLRVSVSDTGSGVNSCSITVDGPGANDSSPSCSGGINDFTLSGPDGTYEISATAEDGAGNSSSDPLTVVLDNTAPDNYAETLGSPNFTGGGITYVKSSTDISVSGDDGSGSGIASCTLNTGGGPGAYTLGSNFNLPAGDGAKSYTVACTDNLGNTDAGFSETRTVDDSAPDNYSETIGNPKYTSGGTTFVKSTTNIKVTGDDGTGSGVDSCTKAFDGGATSSYTLGGNLNLPTPDGAHSYEIVCQDHLGNTSAGFSRTRSVDDTGPTVNVTGVTDGATYTLGSVPVAGCSTSDGGSGVATNASLNGPSGLSVNGVGTATGSCGGATDNLGNPQSPDPKTFKFYVVYGGVSGILQPINPDNTSVFSRGKAVPVKLRLAGDEYFGFNTTGWKIQRQQVACSAFDGNDAVLEDTPSNTPSTTFRYDSSADQYIYNADMHSLAAGTCWNFKVTLDSAQVLYSAVFKLQR